MDTLLKDKIIAQGMDPDTVAEQISNFKDGFPYLKITGPATPQDGIQVLSDDQLKHFVETYPKKAASIEVVKFVPASGAASRMFKDLFSFLDGDGDLSKSAFVQKFIDKIEKFAFYDDLNATLKEKNTSIADCLDRKDYKEIVGTLLEDSGLEW